MPFSVFTRQLLACLLLVGVSATQLHAADSNKTKTTTDTKSQDAKQAAVLKKLKMAPNETALFVGDMHCKTCAKKVASKIYGVKGVKKVRTNVKEDVAIITPQQKKTLDVNALWKAAQKAGFPPVKLVGPSGTYGVDEKTKGAKLLKKPVPTVAKKS